MRWTFDANANAFYVYITEAKPASQYEVSDGVIADLDATGALCGVEVLGANRMLDLKGLDRFEVSDQVLMTLVALATLPFPVFVPNPDDAFALRISDVRTDNERTVGVPVEFAAA